jgi:hypothetical protein
MKKVGTYGHLAYFMAIWYIFNHFGILNKEKSGIPASSCQADMPRLTVKFSEDLPFPGKYIRAYLEQSRRDGVKEVKQKKKLWLPTYVCFSL